MKRTAAFIFAHPDDETFLASCLIRQLTDNGDQPILLLATRGDAGKKNGDVGHLTEEQLGARREKEMERAAAILGLKRVEHLGLPDGKLNAADDVWFVKRVAEFIRAHEPEIVITFPEDGGNFHPDHMAISKITTSAVLSGDCPSVQKLYYVASETLKEQGHRPSVSIDTEPWWDMKAAALKAHDSQKYAIARYFGDLRFCPQQRRYEAFVLAWERGSFYPAKSEQSVTDGLV
ncbi:PIG-L family deacetylase [Paenibacillus doosanensis]|uniref:PIG-L deacetylase family protein n=1 Tax=Paenibacillus doosanensis TaxID=1229154 RepID=UPI0021806FCE|nr:PIG-L family deacetylase [Paenibacillus doosanensis]MCS7459738.1 PIG-L family deacetylase [Paenibacillus doosanensis]